MESGAQELMMNEIVRRLGVTLTPKCLDQQECQDSNGLFISGVLGHGESGQKTGLEGLS